MTEVSRNGLRPRKHKRIPELIYQFLEDCWHDNPDLRPSFDECIQRLKEIEFPPSTHPYPYIVQTNPSTVQVSNSSNFSNQISEI